MVFSLFIKLKNRRFLRRFVLVYPRIFTYIYEQYQQKPPGNRGKDA